MVLVPTDLLLPRSVLGVFAFTTSLHFWGVFGNSLPWMLVEICFNGKLGSSVLVRFLADTERLIVGTICHLSTGAAGVSLRRMKSFIIASLFIFPAIRCNCQASSNSLSALLNFPPKIERSDVMAFWVDTYM